MDDYQRALDFLYSFINFEQNPLDRYQASKIDAARPARLLALLGSPQARYRSIHIAGTKGKGSVAAMCAASLRAAGLRVGLYTSPHLREFRERIRVLTPDDADGRISEADFVRMMDRARQVLPDVPGITWFEIVTALGLLYFAEAAVDIAVVEVGLGGRLDATNVLLPEVSVITRLSMDHTQLLGDTLALIAGEKAGIIKPGVPVVSAPQKEEALAVLEAVAAERGSPLTVIGRDWEVEGVVDPAWRKHHLVIRGGPDPAFIPPGTRFPVALQGNHQLQNAAVALAALQQVRQHYPALDLAALVAGLGTVEWDGRMQVLQDGPDRPTVLVDCAHNEDSAARLRDTLVEEYAGRRILLVFGAPSDKNIAAMMELLFPLVDHVFVTTANHPRSAAPEWLAGEAAARGCPASVTHSVGEALEAALAAAEPGDLIVATGSIIVVGDLLNHWDALQSSATHHG
jgi:dihydrofolate synthase/folylpolyglutamate synthase